MTTVQWGSTLGHDRANNLTRPFVYNGKASRAYTTISAKCLNTL